LHFLFHANKKLEIKLNVCSATCNAAVAMITNATFIAAKLLNMIRLATPSAQVSKQSSPEGYM